MKKIITCPNCNNVTELGSSNIFRPFCSERCRLIDLGKWVEEKYSIADPMMPDFEQNHSEKH